MKTNAIKKQCKPYFLTIGLLLPLSLTAGNEVQANTPMPSTPAYETGTPVTIQTQRGIRSKFVDQSTVQTSAKTITNVRGSRAETIKNAKSEGLAVRFKQAQRPRGSRQSSYLPLTTLVIQ
jgi:hypothetical protein